MYMVRVDESAGIRRDDLVEALIAEGVPAYFAYKALPDLPLFARESLWAGAVPSPLGAEHVREAVRRHDVTNARRLAAQSLWLHHCVLLGGATVQNAVAAAFEKILRHTGYAAPPLRAAAG
jgi:dTDP-4-amino-4,6-dideoxygalactose transaminase